jgi:cytochrome c biogenesis protein ResB
MLSVSRFIGRFFASNALAVVLLLLLMLLTFLGTLQQVEQGLYQVQKEYFGSLFLVHWFGGVVPVPLPGVYLLLVLVFINVACGAIVRAQEGWRHAGILIAHAGILLLLAGSFVTFKYAVRGYLTLNEGEQSGRFQSSDEWEIVIAPSNRTGETVALVIPGNEFAHLRGDRSRTFYAGALPFDLSVTGYAENASVETAPPGRPARGKVVDGAHVNPLPPAREVEENVPAAYLSVRETGSGTTREYLLSGAPGAAIALRIGDQDWTVELKRRSWPLPFMVLLTKFTREPHPGTNIPKVFRSDIVKIEGDSRQPVEITMNEPFRHKGYTLYQASGGRSNAGPDDRCFSTFAVVRNPAESLPLYSCSIVGFGLLAHFSLKLFRYLRTQSRAGA